METPGYSDRSDDEVTAPTGGGAETEDEPVASPADQDEDAPAEEAKG